MEKRENSFISADFKLWILNNVVGWPDFMGFQKLSHTNTERDAKVPFFFNIIKSVKTRVQRTKKKSVLNRFSSWEVSCDIPTVMKFSRFKQHFAIDRLRFKGICSIFVSDLEALVSLSCIGHTGHGNTNSDLLVDRQQCFLKEGTARSSKA